MTTRNRTLPEWADRAEFDRMAPDSRTRSAILETENRRWSGICPQMVGIVLVKPTDVRNMPGSNVITQRSRGPVGGPGTRLLSHCAADGQESVRPWITTDGRCGDESVSGSWRPLLPGVMSVRARWRRRRARAHLMNELLAAMDTPSRLDREDRVCAPRSVLDARDPLAGGSARVGTARTSVRLSRMPSDPDSDPPADGAAAARWSTRPTPGVIRSAFTAPVESRPRVSRRPGGWDPWGGATVAVAEMPPPTR